MVGLAFLTDLLRAPAFTYRVNQLDTIVPITSDTVGATVLEYLDRLSELNRCPECGRPMFMREARKLQHIHHHHVREG